MVPRAGARVADLDDGVSLRGLESKDRVVVVSRERELFGGEGSVGDVDRGRPGEIGGEDGFEEDVEAAVDDESPLLAVDGDSMGIDDVDVVVPGSVDGLVCEWRAATVFDAGAGEVVLGVVEVELVVSLIDVQDDGHVAEAGDGGRERREAGGWNAVDAGELAGAVVVGIGADGCVGEGAVAVPVNAAVGGVDVEVEDIAELLEVSLSHDGVRGDYVEFVEADVGDGGASVAVGELLRGEAATAEVGVAHDARVVGFAVGVVAVMLRAAVIHTECVAEFMGGSGAVVEWDVQGDGVVRSLSTAAGVAEAVVKEANAVGAEHRLPDVGGFGAVAVVVGVANG